MVGTSPRSLNATSSNSESRWSDARKKLRPMRPNPLMPTRVFAMARTLATSPKPGRRNRSTACSTTPAGSDTSQRSLREVSEVATNLRQLVHRPFRPWLLHCAEAVDRAHLAAQVAHVRLGVDRADARRPLERLRRGEL